MPHSRTNPISVVVAGSTSHTRQCVEALAAHSAFSISGVITPSPKPQGRKKELKKNPLHSFALEHHIPLVTIDSKIDATVQNQLISHMKPPDILLVVDFGFIVPSWLLQWPRIAPVNIHPSNLPKYRGSSPGQFVLLFGETASAVTCIRMDEKLDHGPIIEQVFFDIAPAWTASDYYAHAFTLIAHELPRILMEFVNNSGDTAPQPDSSPTPTARMLKREDGYVPLQALQNILTNGVSTIEVPFLATYNLSPTAHNLFNMWRGLTPWPGLWTTSGHGERETRVKLLELEFENNTIRLLKIQLEGKLPTTNVDKVLEQ